jgi:hypothetical protein
LATTELNRQPGDDEDRDVRITLSRRVAATMSISLREAALQVPVREADAHPDFRDRIAELKGRRREAIARAAQAAHENVAANEAAKRAEAHLDGLTAERTALDAQYPALAVAFAKGDAEAIALVAHQRSVASLDGQIHALTIALPMLQDEAGRVMQRNELFARAPDDLAVELNDLRAEAAAEIARSRW